MDIESYIKDLSPELQEKARACASLDELLALAKEENVALPDEALAAVAGGADQQADGCFDTKCPKCGSKDTTLKQRGTYECLYVCNACGHKWWQSTYPIR